MFLTKKKKKLLEEIKQLELNIILPDIKTLMMTFNFNLH